MTARRLSPLERAAALRPQPMTPEEVADLVERARANDERARADGIAKQAAACKATWRRKSGGAK